jgi:hypothetical protein
VSHAARKNEAWPVLYIRARVGVRVMMQRSVSVSAKTSNPLQRLFQGLSNNTKLQEPQRLSHCVKQESGMSITLLRRNDPERGAEAVRETKKNSKI